MKSFKILSDKELIERKKYCEAYKLCFITKEPLVENPIIELHPLLGSVQINQYKLMMPR